MQSVSSTDGDSKNVESSSAAVEFAEKPKTVEGESFGFETDEHEPEAKSPSLQPFESMPAADNTVLQMFGTAKNVVTGFVGKMFGGKKKTCTPTILFQTIAKG